MEIKSSKKDEVLVVEVSGELDVLTSPELERVVIEAIEAGSRNLVLDLAHLRYISSAGVRVFLLALKRLKDKGGHIAFAGLQPDVRRVFDITGFSFRVPLFASTDEAVKGLSGTSAGG